MQRLAGTSPIVTFPHLDTVRDNHHQTLSEHQSQQRIVDISVGPFVKDGNTTHHNCRNSKRKDLLAFKYAQNRISGQY